MAREKSRISKWAGSTVTEWQEQWAGSLEGYLQQAQSEGDYRAWPHQSLRGISAACDTLPSLSCEGTCWAALGRARGPKNRN
jgi:hypothetical protein